MRSPVFVKSSSGLIGDEEKREEKLALNRWSMITNFFIVLMKKLKQSISDSPQSSNCKAILY